MRILMVSFLLLFPTAALADIVILTDLSGMRTESPGSRMGASVGLGIAADTLEVGPISAGPDFRVGTGRTSRDQFAHGAIGAHLSFDILVRVSLALRMGAGHLEGGLPGTRYASGHKGVAPVVESDLTVSLPIGPAIAGIRFGRGRFAIADKPDYRWDSVGAALGVRF